MDITPEQKFKNGCINGNIVEVIDSINMGVDILPTDDNTSLLEGIKNAVLHIHVNIIELFLKNYNIPALYIYNANKDYILHYKRISMVKLLIEFGLDPMVNDNIIYEYACKNDNTKLLYFLLNIKKLNPVTDSNFLFSAIIYGNLKIVKMLVKICHMKITYEFIKLAIMYHQTDIFKYMIKRKENDWDINNLLMLAIKRDSEEIVKILIDEGVDATFNDNVAIQYACVNGNINIVELLLNDINVDPSALHNVSLCNAIIYGYYDIIKLLLSLVNRPVDPADDNNLPIRIAYNNCIKYGSQTDQDILLLIYNDYRIDKTSVPLFISQYISDINNNIDNININELPPLISIHNF
jgi:ankyrin repeat protein